MQTSHSKKLAASVVVVVVAVVECGMWDVVDVVAHIPCELS